MVRSIDIATLAQRHTEGGIVVDCRELRGYVAGLSPGSLFAPMSRIMSYLDEIPVGVDVHVICESGNRSTAIAEILERTGRSALSVEGGTAAWRAAGHPIEEGPPRT